LRDTTLGLFKEICNHWRRHIADRLCSITLANVYGSQIEYSGPLANLFNAAGLPAAPFRTDAPVPNEVVGD